LYSSSPVWARSNPISPLSLYVPTSLPSTLHSTLSFIIFYFSLSYSLYLFSCFSIPSHSTRIVPLHFQARCCRMRLDLAFVFCVDFVICIIGQGCMLVFVVFDLVLCCGVIVVSPCCRLVCSFVLCGQRVQPSLDPSTETF